MGLTVIIGAGSSGAVLAHRLSANPACELLVCEAGPDYAAEALPRDLADGTRNSMRRHDWGYAHAPSEVAREAPMPRGRVVGGSSAVNTCIALRGQPEDFDEWAALGLTDWTWQKCLPAFKRLERDLDFGATDEHGGDGPMPLRRHPASEWCTVQAAFVEACRELGYPECKDENARGSVGVGAHAMNKLAGRRISAAEAYLTPEVRARPNLRIQARTLVRRVLFRDRRVVGVELESEHGEVSRVEAERVIVCAGALNTPGVLLRSGVGPDREVRRLQCEPVWDAPAVGRRLLDHPGTGVFALAKRSGAVDFAAPLMQTALRYASGAFEHPTDIMLQAASFVLLPRKPPVFGVVAQIGKVFGHGELVHPDANPHTKPIIRSRFFEDPRERKLGVDALRACHRVLRTRALSAIGVAVAPFGALLRSDFLLDRIAPRWVGSGYHPSGTVPMGVGPSERAAVDPHGRVFGVEGLCVVDASLMPTIPSSNIHLPTLMIAERMADWLA